MTLHTTRYASWALMIALVLGISSSAWAGSNCPFCNAPQQTLSEEMNSADAVILAQLVSVPPPAKPTDGEQPPPALSKFQVVKVIKGANLVRQGGNIETVHFGEPNKKITYLLIGTLLPDLKWGTPIALSEEAIPYVTKLLTLPAEGADRLAFFQDYLESKDAVLMQDSYDEFAKAPYSAVIALKSRMRHDQLIQWIKKPDGSPSHRRLYLLMLGICGGPQDIPFLEEMMKGEDRRLKAGLDSMIACYLTLKGVDGMPLVEDLFLKNTKAEFADTYSAVMALRFQGEEGQKIPKDRLLQGLRHLLDRPELADLVISDLARWEDWSVIDRMAKLFKNATADNSWIRVPVINYLQACGNQDNETGNRALAVIDELEKIDPNAVKQARATGAFGALWGGKGKAATTPAQGDEKEPPKTERAKTSPPAR